MPVALSSLTGTARSSPATTPACEALFELLGDLNRSEGLALLLVEQNAELALSIAHRGYVLETGRIVLAGPAEQKLPNPWVG